MSESPYFQRRSSSPSASNKVDMSHNGSRHFVRSPSSALGSVLSMGPFLSTLTDLSLSSRASCCRSKEESSVFCPECAPAIESACTHFSHCPVFADSFNLWLSTACSDNDGGSVCFKDEKGDESFHENGGKDDYQFEKHKLTCWQEAEILIFRSVRHLCAELCYLRAFAPARDWHALQTRVSEITGRSPDNLLRGWRCCLATCYCDCKDKDAEKLEPPLECTNNSPGSCPRACCSSSPVCQTVYVAPSKMTHTSKVLALKSLGLIPSTQRRKTTCSPKRLLTPDNAENSQCGSLSAPVYLDADTDHDPATSGNPLKTWVDLFPASPFGLLEELFVLDPWCLLLSAIMLNRTTRVQVDPVLYAFLRTWQDPESAALASPDSINRIIRPLGISNRRAKAIVRFSTEYLALIRGKDVELLESTRSETMVHKTRTLYGASRRKVLPQEFGLTKEEVLSLYNCGDYAYDAYKIFVQRKHHEVSSDRALQCYVDYCRGLDWSGDCNNCCSDSS